MLNDYAWFGRFFHWLKISYLVHCKTFAFGEALKEYPFLSGARVYYSSLDNFGCCGLLTKYGRANFYHRKMLQFIRDIRELGKVFLRKKLRSQEIHSCPRFPYLKFAASQYAISLYFSIEKSAYEYLEKMIVQGDETFSHFPGRRSSVNICLS